MWMKAVHRVMIPNPTVEAGTTQNPNFLTIRPPGISTGLESAYTSTSSLPESLTGKEIDDKVEACSNVELKEGIDVRLTRAETMAVSVHRRS